MLGVISLGGQCIYNERLKNFVCHADYFIAADSGMRHFIALSIKADALIGDMDSIELSLLNKVRSDPSIEVEIYNPKKNQTDSEIAADKAISYGCDLLVFIGTSGNRPDHVLANQMMAAAIAQRGIPCVLTDGITYLYTITPKNSPFHYDLTGLQADVDILSIIPVKGDIQNLTIENLEYPLPMQFVPYGKAIAVSNTVPVGNDVSKTPAIVTLDSGVVFFIHTVNDSRG